MAYGRNHTDRIHKGANHKLSKRKPTMQAAPTTFAELATDPGERYAFRRALGAGAQGSVSVIERCADGVRLVLKESNCIGTSERDLERACSEVVHLALAVNHGNVVRFHEAWLRAQSVDPRSTEPPRTFRVVSPGTGASGDADTGSCPASAAEVLTLARDGELMLTLCIVMDYAPGGTLTNQIREARSSSKRLAEGNIVLWVGQLALGLIHLHSLGILHRDLKTCNVFLTPSGCIKIGDLGVSKLMMNSDDGMAHTTTGTPLYMAPEILRGEPYGYACDVWALGCVLVEMLTLDYAFKAPNVAQLYLRIEQGRLASELPACFSTELRELAHALLTHDPSERPTLIDVLNVPIIKNAIAKWMREVVGTPAGAARARGVRT